MRHGSPSHCGASLGLWLALDAGCSRSTWLALAHFGAARVQWLAHIPWCSRRDRLCPLALVLPSETGCALWHRCISPTVARPEVLALAIRVARPAVTVLSPRMARSRSLVLPERMAAAPRFGAHFMVGSPCADGARFEAGSLRADGAPFEAGSPHIDGALLLDGSPLLSWCALAVWLALGCRCTPWHLARSWSVALLHSLARASL
jgi:hypothetical protein